MKKKSILIFLVSALVLLISLSVVACKPAIEVTGVSLDREVLSLVVGTEGTLVATVEPEDATDQTVAWTSADTAVATVDENGKVTAVAVGETEVTVTTTDGEFTAKCEVIVTAAPVVATGLALNKATMELTLDGKFQLRPEFTPKATTNQNIKSWTSSSPGVATVSTNGLVVAVSVGTTTITAVSEDGNFEGKCVITVAQRGEGILVVGYSPFSSKFSPFFSKTAYDADVAAMTQVSLLTTDRLGNLVLNAIEGEKIDYMGTKYEYKGIANFTIDKSTEAPYDTKYTITIKDGLKFSNGSSLTIDDVIFTMYVLSDPSYTGSSTLYSAKIKGMEDYRTEGKKEAFAKQIKAYMEPLNNLVEALVEKEITLAELDEDQRARLDDGILKMQETAAWGWVSSYTVDDLIAFGFGEADSTPAEVYFNLAFYNEIMGGYYKDYVADIETNMLIGLAKDYVTTNPNEMITNITGIKRINDYTMTVETDGYEATTIYKLGVSVAPLYYYGDVNAYDYANNKFGFTKYDLSGVEAKTTKPVGAGAYKFDKFENGIVYFEANEYYFKGEPIIKNIQFRETSDTDKVSGILAGTFDVTDPSLSNAALAQIKGANTNSEIDGDYITTSLVDNLGYGYIGINAKNVKVDISNSAASKSLRKAYATLFAVYREVVVNSYYGDRASVIEYPISNTSWAAPQPTEDGFETAYSTNSEGKKIYTAAMTQQQKYAAALEAAVGFFEAAGFTKNSSGKFTDVPAVTAHIPADGTGDHPAFGILTYVKAALETIGVTLNITDYADSDNFWPVLEAGEADIWCAAWGASIDPDMYQVYHSSNIVGLPDSTGSNHYAITDNRLDAAIFEARESDDQGVRKGLYKECLELILDWAVEIPTYQRKNAVVFSPKRVNLETLTPDITTFWGWMNDIELLELNN